MDEDWKPVLEVDWLLEDLKAMMTAAMITPYRMEGLGNAIDAVSEHAFEVKESELVE